MAGYIYLVQMDVPAEKEADFNRVYDTQHVPELSKVPGVRKVTRYCLESANVDGVAKYAASMSLTPRTSHRVPPGTRPRTGATGPPRSGPTPPTART